MTSYSSIYRLNHPEWREAEKIRNNIREKARYNNDPEYKERAKKNALNRYYKLKELKAQQKKLEEQDEEKTEEKVLI